MDKIQGWCNWCRKVTLQDKSSGQAVCTKCGSILIVRKEVKIEV